MELRTAICIARRPGDFAGRNALERALDELLIAKRVHSTLAAMRINGDDLQLYIDAIESAIDEREAGRDPDYIDEAESRSPGVPRMADHQPSYHHPMIKRVRWETD